MDPVTKFVVDPKDVLLLRVTVLDAHDSGNVQLSLSDKRSLLASIAELEAAVEHGGRHVLVDPATGKVIEDPLGTLGPKPVENVEEPAPAA